MSTRTLTSSLPSIPFKCNYGIWYQPIRYAIDYISQKLKTLPPGQDDLYLRSLKCDFVLQLKSFRPVLAEGINLSYVDFRIRIDLQKKMVCLMLQDHPIDVDKVVLHLQVLWRLEYFLDIFRAIRTYPSSYSEDSFRFKLPHIKLCREALELKTFEEIFAFYRNPIIHSHFTLLVLSTQELRFFSIEQPRKPSLECITKQGLEIAREDVVMFLMAIFDSPNRVIENLSQEEQKKVIELFSPIVESVLLLNRMICLFYLRPVNQIETRGIPW